MADEGPILAERVISPELPILKDHFPGNPIFPAFLQLEWVEQSLKGLGGIEAFLNVKFLKPVLPGDTIRLRLDKQSPGGCDFSILVAAQVATKGKIRFA